MSDDERVVRSHQLLSASRMLAHAASDLAFLAGSLHEGGDDGEVEEQVTKLRQRIDVIAASIEVGRLT